MSAVVALSDLLLQERDTLNDEQVEHLSVIQTSGNHLLTVINDILDISKMNHDPKFKLENRRFSIRKCVKGIFILYH
jgi:signal transduction histidine kinase